MYCNAMQCMYVCTYAPTCVPLGIGLGGNTPLHGSGGGQYHRGDKECATHLYICIYLNSSILHKNTIIQKHTL